MPHGHCYLWQPDLLWLHVISDALIAMAYFSIPVTLVYFVRRRADLEFHWIFLCFAVFILACGASHVMEIWTVWHGDYWSAGIIKAVTAMASIPTAIALMKLVPYALALPSPAALAASNEQLRAEVLERTRVEQVLSEKNLELETLNGELKAFSYSVSHDLRAPLRSMDGFSLVLLEDYDTVLDGAGKDALRRIRHASQRMGTLIDDILRLSQVVRAELHREQVDLSAMCGDIAAQLAADAPGRSLDWIIEPGMRIDGDKSLLRIALQNLMANAVKFTGRVDEALIRVGSNTNSGQTVYFVEDNGAGFDSADAAKIFEEFQRLHAHADFPGTGIGLALVNRIILRHGGRIWAEAEPGTGATFFFHTRQGK